MEIKIKHRENPFQYSHYRGFLTRKGFETKAVGLLPNKLASRGLIDAVLVQTADARISWGGLLSRLRLASRSAKEVSELLEQLVIIYPDVAAGTWVGTPVKPAERAMASVGDGADTLAVLVRDLIEQLPPGCIAFPDQAGNAPPVLRMGKSSWAEWFEDEDETRILLNFDIPRRSKAMSQLHFEFCIELFSKTYAGLVS